MKKIKVELTEQELFLLEIVKGIDRDMLLKQSDILLNIANSLRNEEQQSLMRGVYALLDRLYYALKSEK